MIVAKNYIKTGFSIEDAEKITNQIEPLLSTDGKIEIDFTGIDIFTTLFFNNALAKFILDTNVLYFIHSGYYGQTTEKNKNYSNLIQTLVTHDCTIIVSTINLQELFHGIENNEYRLYLKNNKLLGKNYTKKDFRKNIDERKKIKNKLTVILSEITQVYEIIDEKIAIKDLKDFITTFSSHRYDPVDYILVKNNTSDNDVFFVTDDKDFHCDQSITVLTP